MNEWRMKENECITHTSRKQPPTGGGGSRRMDVLDVVIYNLPSKKNNIPKSSPTPHKTVIYLMVPFLSYRLLRICYNVVTKSK